VKGTKKIDVIRSRSASVEVDIDGNVCKKMSNKRLELKEALRGHGCLCCLL
jgi:hypothetical protein